MTKKQITYTPTDIAQFQKILGQTFPGGRHLSVLEVCAHTGVANMKQLMAATNLSRDRLRSFLKYVEELTPDGAILSRVPFDVPKPSVRGRPSTVYTLGKVGATLLRANGHPKAHACALNDARTIAHARAVLDVRLAAEAAGFAIQTERELPYTTSAGEQKVLRPDAQVRLVCGILALIEVEQVAGLSLLRRRVAFFQSEEAAVVSFIVRVLINLPPGRDLDRTISVWERATAIVAEECGGELPFEIVALPLQEFLSNPDWSEPPNGRLWESLFDPSQVSTFAPSSSDQGKGRALVPTKKGRRSTPVAQQEKLPNALRRRSARDDYLIMRAFWHYLHERDPSLMHSHDRPQPNPVFFDLVRVVHAASHPPDATPWEQALHPHASLYLLQQYLQMHPRLHKSISKTVTRGGGSVRWSTPVITHRIQVVIDIFLRYHGFRSSGSLWASPAGPWQRNDGRGDFDIRVRLDREMLMGDSDGVIPSREEVKKVEDALAWVLRALFAYSEDLDLKQAVFW
ncbi:MAG: hypothetical protein GY832_40610 [Chloroflexi bacterium]|nr:hypothetical protein [Chloroflexota bacterium]